jgi:hypothetical protein
MSVPIEFPGVEDSIERMGDGKKAGASIGIGALFIGLIFLKNDDAKRRFLKRIGKR